MPLEEAHHPQHLSITMLKIGARASLAEWKASIMQGAL
jgi:hypothetical protein